jgi:hypothetical protein
LRLLGGPCLLRFASPDTSSGAEGVRCRYAIVGGLLTRRAGGSLTLSENASELRAAVEGFAPRLKSHVYEHLQHRLHVAVSRRYFAALLTEAPG